MPKKKKKSKSKKRQTKKKVKVIKRKTSKRRKILKRKTKRKSKPTKKKQTNNDTSSQELVFKTRPEWVKSSLANKSQYQNKYSDSIKNNKKKNF